MHPVLSKNGKFCEGWGGGGRVSSSKTIKRILKHILYCVFGLQICTETDPLLGITANDSVLSENELKNSGVAFQ